ncbi:MAG TPA: hypothetical protein DHV62_06365 [Elusimicrobia bacterium]|jgi:excisionase family DNA binding protein|nr:hypothetical protein [Elusimicrobiota bacterium]
MVYKVNSPEVLTLKETAELLKLRPEKVYLLAENGKLPGAKVGGRWRFVRKEILHWGRKMKKSTNKFFSQELPLICMLIAVLFSIFELTGVMLGRAEESRPLREIAEREPLREKEEEYPFKVNSPFGPSSLRPELRARAGRGQVEPWWQFPGWETVLAVVGCLYFILAKHFFQHFLAK